ncbi:MAG: hypothetical protein ACOVMI_08870 [Chitinophagaceae bacterium]|jgi:hypothetical protein
MATVILEIPSEKMRSFMQMVINLGIEKHSIKSEASIERNKKYNNTRRNLANNFLLFDWEFFNNELEFE